jgi:plastocyanin
VLAGVIVLAAVASCDRLSDSGPATLELEGDTIQLDAGVRLIDVNVETQPDGAELEPARVEAAPGDVVRFTAGDGRLHALAFETSLLSPEARAFLEQTGQLRSPPLISAGMQWVITLAGAPPGEYPFTCTTHAVRGSIVVGARAD